MAKFEIGQKVLHDGVEREVLVSRKDFPTKKIFYKLDNGEQVAESELKAVKSKMTRTKKLNQKDQSTLDERLDKLVDFQVLIESDPDYDKVKFEEALVKMTVKQFDNFYNDLFEKALLNSDETED